MISSTEILHSWNVRQIYPKRGFSLQGQSSHLEVTIAGAPMSHHGTCGPTPKRAFFITLSFLVKRDQGPDGVDVESHGPVVGARHQVSSDSVRGGEADE